MTSASSARATPMLIFDPEDAFLRSRGVSGKHPRAMDPMRLSLVARVEAGEKKPQRLSTPVQLQVVPNASGYLLFFGAVIAPNGKPSKIAADGWPWTIRVDSEYYQPLEVTLTETPGAFGGKGEYVVNSLIKLDLQPGPAYPFPHDPLPHAHVIMRGAVRHTDGAGWAAVQVAALSSDGQSQAAPAMTCADGQWVLAIPSDVALSNLRLRFMMPDGTQSDVGPISARADRDNNVSQPALRGEVRQRNRGVQGAVITIEKSAGTTLTDANGNWFFYFGMNQSAENLKVTATLPDGNKSISIVASVQPLATIAVPRFEF